MATAALVVSVLALVCAAWAAVSYQRQATANIRAANAAERTDEAAQRSADAAERSAKAAETSAEEAANSLRLARELESRETARHHGERQPVLTLELVDRGAAERQRARLHSDGPVPYDRVDVWPDGNDTETQRLVLGVSTAPDADEDRLVIPHLAVGQDIDFFVLRSDPEKRGRARFIITSWIGDDEWQTVKYIDLQRPARALFM